VEPPAHTSQCGAMAACAAAGPPRTGQRDAAGPQGRPVDALWVPWAAAGDRGRMTSMRRIMSHLHQGLAWIAMVGWVAELYLIGTAVFGVTSTELHRRLGM